MSSSNPGQDDQIKDKIRICGCDFFVLTVAGYSWVLSSPESFALQNLISEKDSMSYGVPPCGFLSWDPIRHPKFGVHPSSPYGKAKSRSFELVTCVRVCSRVQQELGHMTLR